MTEVAASSPQESPSSRPPVHAVLTRTSFTSSQTYSSSSSWDSQTIFGDDDDDDVQSSGHKAVQRQLLPRDVSDKLEPFEALPVVLSRFAEGLVSFYLLHYPKQTYVFNQNLNPHPVYTNFAIAMNAPACFQCILARSALYKMSAGQYGTNLEKAELETAVAQHKTNAIHRIRELSSTKTPDKDELVASIISLGTLDMRMGSTMSAGMHYSAVRRLLKELGGPLHIRDMRLKRVMCFFECIYGTVSNSYIWEHSDFGVILERLNQYLAELWEGWKNRSTSPGSLKTSKSPRAAVPFPRTIGGAPTSGPGSNSRPTSHHTPYFGLQPLPEVVFQARKRESFRPLVGPPPPATAYVPQISRIRAVKASSSSINQSTKRTAKQETRMPAKERAKKLERQKEKQTAMQVDHEAVPIRQIKPSMVTAPPIPLKEPASAAHNPPVTAKRSYWKMNPESALHRRLLLYDDLAEDKKKPALIWDLACLFCLSAIVADYVDRDVKPLATYMSKLSKIVHDANLHFSENNSNMMWLIQTNDSTDEHSRRMWEVAALTWVCKHLNGNVQRRLRDWLFAYLTGEEVQRKITLTTFDFSYDRSML